MAGNWYRDEDRGGNNQWRGNNDRGFLERAGEEVRSWFASGEQSGGQDRSEPWGGGDWAGSFDRSDRRSGRGYRESHYGKEHGYGGFQGDYGGGAGQGGFGGQGDYQDGRQSFSSGGHTGSPWDDHYRSWRDRQIEQMDRDYAEYCSECQQSFHTDFDSWRKNRQSQGGSGLGTSASTGSTGMMDGDGNGGFGGVASLRTSASLRPDDESGGSEAGAEAAGSDRSEG